MLNAADDDAGTSIQCMRCSALVDVPTLDELAGMNPDGTFELKESKPRAKPKLADNSELPHFANRGQEADLRIDMERFMKIGQSSDDLLEIRDESSPGTPRHPRYDPVTGELVRPIEVKKDPEPQVMEAIPVTGPVLGYQREVTTTGVVNRSVFSPFVLMFKPSNLIVWFIMTGLLSIVIAMAGVPFAGLLFLLFLTMPVVIMSLGHLGNIIDDVGPGGHDEIPTPLRQISFSEDIWRPTVAVILSFFIASLPGFALRFSIGAQAGPIVEWLTLLAAIAAALIWPAALLTAATSGSIANLMPQRILKTAIASGWKYFVVAGTGLVGYYLTAVGVAMMFITGIVFAEILFPSPVAPVAARQIGPFTLTPTLVTILALPTLAAGLYFLHVFGWQLGLVYRRHHANFDWLYQGRIKSDRDDLTSKLKQMRRAGKVPGQVPGVSLTPPSAPTPTKSQSRRQAYNATPPAGTTTQP